MLFDPLDIVLPIEEEIGKTEDPFHRAILLNHHRHVILEVTGRYDEIFSPELTVSHPRYLVAGQTGMGGRVDSVVFDGENAVREMYHAFWESGAVVMCFAGQKIAVCDWGLATEGVLRQFCPGQVLVADGEDVDDPAATYLLSRRAAVNWHYDENALLIGEHAYEDVGSRLIEKCDPADIVTKDMVQDALQPRLLPFERFQRTDNRPRVSASERVPAVTPAYT